jgi:predicted DNA-binding transcriptional regulator YafY
MTTLMLERCAAMLDALRSGRVMNAAELVGVSEVRSTKTIYRTMELLRDRLGFPVEMLPCKGFRLLNAPCRCPLCQNPHTMPASDPSRARVTA